MRPADSRWTRASPYRGDPAPAPPPPQACRGDRARCARCAREREWTSRHGLPERLDLLGAETAHAARCETTVADRSDGHPAQLRHGMADSFEHTADLVPAPLG